MLINKNSCIFIIPSNDIYYTARTFWFVWVVIKLNIYFSSHSTFQVTIDENVWTLQVKLRQSRVIIANLSSENFSRRFCYLAQMSIRNVIMYY
jgi:hypothetical protein